MTSLHRESTDSLMLARVSIGTIQRATITTSPCRWIMGTEVVREWEHLMATYLISKFETHSSHVAAISYWAVCTHIA